MAMKSRAGSRASGRRGETAVKALASGTAFTLAPVFFKHTLVGPGLAALRPLGLLLLAVGVVLVLFGKVESLVQEGGSQQPAKSPIDPSATRNVPSRSHPRPQASRSENPLSRARQETNGRPQRWGRDVFEVIEWRRFEAVVERLFQQAGFETRSQSHGADEGVDVWLYSRHQPGEPVSLVQCKHWQGKRVGVDKIRELRGVMAARNVKRGQFATTSTFTPDAVTFARENGVNLLDADGLLSLIGKRTEEQQVELLDVALEGDYWRPTCVNCGVKMVDRMPRKGGSAFWGCSNYPRCKTTLPMRASSA